MPKKSAERFPGFAACVALLRNRKDAEEQEAQDTTGSSHA